MPVRPKDGVLAYASTDGRTTKKIFWAAVELLQRQACLIRYACGGSVLRVVNVNGFVLYDQIRL